jgi:3-dehydroquinate synthase
MSGRTKGQAMVHTQRLTVGFSYDVVFTRDLFAVANSALADVLPSAESPAKMAVFVDAGLQTAWPGLTAKIAAWAQAHADKVILPERPMIVPGGEDAKNDLTFVQRVTHQLQRMQVCRQSYAMAVGGGAVLDAVGLAAAVFHRGVRLIRVPTTVLAQNDSGVGVKNSINLDGAKNLIGTFAPPHAVLNDALFLTTLSDRDWRGGIAEAVKVAVIKDAAFLDELERLADGLVARDLDAMEAVVKRCAMLHLGHIATAGDPFEMGSARPLDFGHWAAHKLESMTHFELRHGEAVAIGIALDAFCAARLGFISTSERDRICDIMRRCGLNLWHPLLAKRGGSGALMVLEGLEEFRQHLGGRLTLTMPDGIGRMRDIHALAPEVVADGVAWLAAWHAQPLPARLSEKS